jgi:hypothetical protein
MEGLRCQIEKDLHEALEGEWGLPVELTTPDGKTQKYSVNNPSELLKGQVLYFSKVENPEVGSVIVNQPCVTLRISSLIKTPQASEKWLIRMPISPRPPYVFQSFAFTCDRFPESGTDIGFIRIYPEKIEQDGAGPTPIS